MKVVVEAMRMKKVIRHTYFNNVAEGCVAWKIS